jgi:hypothetical protein
VWGKNVERALSSMVSVGVYNQVRVVSECEASLGERGGLLEQRVGNAGVVCVCVCVERHSVVW